MKVRSNMFVCCLLFDFKYGSACFAQKVETNQLIGIHENIVCMPLHIGSDHLVSSADNKKVTWR